MSQQIKKRSDWYIKQFSSLFSQQKNPLDYLFQVKMDTRLAPEHRQKLSDDQKERLGNCVNNQVHML